MDPRVLHLGTSGGEWLTSRPSRITPRERAPGTHWIGGWMGPRTDLDDVKKRQFLTLPGLDFRPSVVSRYTDCAIPALMFKETFRYCVSTATYNLLFKCHE
jgi:hypothetical protein